LHDVGARGCEQNDVLSYIPPRIGGRGMMGVMSYGILSDLSKKTVTIPPINTIIIGAVPKPLIKQFHQRSTSKKEAEKHSKPGNPHCNKEIPR
jgi:hypothetical protein